jgi:tetratricopeptide (TPR) repeat protein
VKLAVVIPPDRGGLEPNSGELDKDYQVRVKAMRTRYDEALATLASGSTARAITALEGIARDAGSRYLEVTPKLNEARKAVAAQAVAEARDFEAKNEYDQAIARFQRAAALDHDAKVDEDIRRVQEKKRQLGLKACDDAKNAYAFNRGQQALQFYQQVIKLLPENDPCFATAKQRIAELGGR